MASVAQQTKESYKMAAETFANIKKISKNYLLGKKGSEYSQKCVA